MNRWRYTAGKLLNARARESVSRPSTANRPPLARNSFHLSRIPRFFENKVINIRWLDGEEAGLGKMGKSEGLGHALLPEILEI